MFVNVTILAKNYKSIISFVRIFSKLCVLNKIKINRLFFKHFQNNHKTIKFKTLKSPHIYKKAQRQFKCYLFSKKYQVFSVQILKLLLVLKHIEFLSPVLGVTIHINFLFNKKKSLKKTKELLKLDNVSTQLKIKIKKYLYCNIKTSNNFLSNYLKLFDYFGKIF